MSLARLRPLLVCLFSSGGLLLFSGCTVVSTNRTFPKLEWYWSTDAKLQREERKADSLPVTDAKSITPNTASVPARADSPRKPFGLAWESEWTVDGEITGIESSTNLIYWQVETQWTLASDWPASVTVSNTWRDPQPGESQKFYRAFNRGP